MVNILSSDDVGPRPTELLQNGRQVVVKPGQDWILAIVTRWIPEKGKYEVEDAEDDENAPGTRKYCLI